MARDVYIDILFLINFSMDYICIYICSKVLHRRMSPPRMIAAAAIGGIWSVISLFLPTSSPWELILDCAVGLLLCIIVYAERGRGLSSLLSSSLLFIGVSMMMGGCMTAIFNLLNKLEIPIENIDSDSISTYIFAFLAAIGAIISLRSGQVISKRSNIKECRLYVRLCGIDLEFSGFCDSGNLVKDPISGRAVIFLEREIIEKKMSLKFIDEFVEGKLDTNAPCRDLRFISLKTASGSSMAVCIRPEGVIIEFENRKGKISRHKTDALISPIAIGEAAQGYSAIIPAEILKE